MSFGKLRKAVGQKHSDGIWEMYRFANRLGYRTIGGASKLLSAFIREFSPKTIMSYAARDYSVGSMYEKLGFKKIKITGPGYWYVSEIDLTRYHRFSFRKDKLVKDGYDSTKTEFEIMDELKYLRVWDSGQLVFERTFAK
jgi:hypothetical protein